MPANTCHCDEGYVLPELQVVWHEVPTCHEHALPERDGQGRMFVDSVMGLSQAAQEKRRSLPARVAKMVEILAESPEDHFMVWHDLEDERRAISQAVPEIAMVYGTQDLEAREQIIRDFSDGKLRLMGGKCSMLGSGVNLQRYCHRAIFVGISFKFNDFIQSCHRIQRFLQTEPVRIDLIHSEAERTVKKVLLEKWARYDKQSKHMAGLIQQYGLSQIKMHDAMRRSFGTTRQEVKGKSFTLINNDCVRETQMMPDNSVHLIVSSIPFASQYEYSPAIEDFGHTEDTVSFWKQMDFLTPELLRVLHPGRDMAIHIKDRVVPGGLTGLGFQTVQPFHCEAIFHYQKHGFAFLGMKTVCTDVVREHAATYRLGWSEQCRDGSRMGYGLPEYILLFRKPPSDAANGYADVPVEKAKPNTEYPDGTVGPYDYDGGKIVPGTGYSRARWQIDAHGFERSSGNRLLTAEDMLHMPHADIYKRWREESLQTVYDHARHVHLGELMEREKRLPSGFMLMPPHSWHPDIWSDVARMRTLNMEQERRGQEMHLCPLSYDVVERMIVQLSMPGEVVLDPFSGIGTVAYMAIKLGRKGIGIELNARYHADAVKYCQEAEMQRDVPSLFDLMECEANVTTTLHD